MAHHDCIEKRPLLAQEPTKPKGGDEGNRTPDLCHATAALSQLSYVPRTSVNDSKTAITVNKNTQKEAAPRFTKMNPPQQGGRPHRSLQRP